MAYMPKNGGQEDDNDQREDSEVSLLNQTYVSFFPKLTGLLLAEEF